MNRWSLRDGSKKRGYAAENKAFTEGCLEVKRFASHAEMTAWVNNLTGSAWFQKAFPHVKRIQVRKRRGVMGATGNYDPLWKRGTINIPDSPWGLRKWIVCHELGHAVTPLYNFDHGRRTAIAAGHGREWRNNYIKLVQHALGVDAAKRLKQAFKEAKLPTGEKRAKRVLTPEQRAALVERLAKAREARNARASLARSNGIAAMLGMASARPRWSTYVNTDGVVIESYGVRERGTDGTQKTN